MVFLKEMSWAKLLVLVRRLEYYARMRIGQKLMRIAVLATNSRHRSPRFELCGRWSGSVGVMSCFGHQPLTWIACLESPLAWNLDCLESPLARKSFIVHTLDKWPPLMCPLEVLKCAPDHLRQVDNIDLSKDITLWGCQPVLKSAPDSLVRGWFTEKSPSKGGATDLKNTRLIGVSKSGFSKNASQPHVMAWLRVAFESDLKDAIWRQVHAFVGEYCANIGAFVMNPQLMWAMLAQNWAFLHRCKFPVYWTKLLSN